MQLLALSHSLSNIFKTLLNLKLCKRNETYLACRTLLEKSGLLEKKERPSIAIGKAKIEKEKAAKTKTKEEENVSSEAVSDSNEAES